MFALAPAFLSAASPRRTPINSVRASVGAGFAIGNMMNQSFAQSSAPPPPPSSSAPPPPPGAASAARWSLAIDGKTYGPYTDDAVRGMLSSGQVDPATQAWRPGASAWAPLSSYSELDAGGAAPPPPPPPPPVK